MDRGRPEIVVPEEASERGHILKGELRSADIRIPGILTQLSPMTPHNMNASVFFYPDLDQAKVLLAARSPFSFEGSLKFNGRTETRYRSSEVWLNYGREMTFYEMRCFTQCSGRLVDLQATNIPESPPQEPGSGSAWFVANGCYAVRLLATPAQDEQFIAKRHKVERIPHRFELSDCAVAEIQRITARHRRKGDKEIRKRGYAIGVESVKSAEAVKRDVEGLLILASFASRERSDFGYWSVREANGTNTQNWRFGMGKWPKRAEGEEPLLRDEGSCRDFLTRATKRYLTAPDASLLDSAVYALLARDLAIETNIVNLYTAVQRALTFALSLPSDSEAKVKELYGQFEKQYTVDISDLWPLFDNSGGASLNKIRNVLVHGRAFTAISDFKTLSIAAENLRWLLERILLAALGCDVEISAVSPKKLNWYTAHNWKEPQNSLKL